MKLKSKFLSLVVSVTSLFVLAGCGSSDGNAPGYSDQRYGGAGSAYELQLNANGTFVVTMKSSASSTTVLLTVNGTYKRLPTGFVAMTISSATGTNAPAAGGQAVGLEVPGFAFLLKPLGGEGKMIPMVSLGKCPTADFNANWISMNKEASADTSDSWGTFNFTAATGACVLPAMNNLATFASVGTNNSIGTGTCSDGVLEIVNNATIYLTSAGGAVVHTTGGDVIGVPKGAVTIAQLAGSYAGLVFDNNQASGSKNFPIAVTLTATGAGTGTKITDVVTGAVSTQTVTLNLDSVNSADSLGFIRASTNASGTTKNAICAAAPGVAGTTKNVLFCSSYASSTAYWSLLLVSK